MSDRVALYAAVLAAPDDDTPRLVYADFLDDTGARADAVRARFIRNQIALARAEPWSIEYDRLLRATEPVASHYVKEWAAGTEGITLEKGNTYARGFVERVTCYAKRFLSDGAHLFAAQPVRAVKFADMTGGRGGVSAAEMAASPLLARLHTAHLVGTPVNDDFAATLAGSPHLGGLRELRVEKSGLGVAGLMALLQLTAAALTKLDLDGNPKVGDAELAALAGSAGVARLRALDLSNTAVGPDGLAELAASPRVSGLEVLRICHGVDAAGPPLRGPGAVTLAASPHLRGLKELDFRAQELRKRGAEVFAAAYAWPGLRRLGLRGNRIYPSAVPAFAANPLLRSLVEIDFCSNPIRSDDLGPLRKACPHTRLMTDDAGGR